MITLTKNAVNSAMDLLIDRDGSATTLDTKNMLRILGYSATQAEVSQFMSEIESENDMYEVKNDPTYTYKIYTAKPAVVSNDDDDDDFFTNTNANTNTTSIKITSKDLTDDDDDDFFTNTTQTQVLPKTQLKTQVQLCKQITMKNGVSFDLILGTAMFNSIKSKYPSGCLVVTNIADNSNFKSYLVFEDGVTSDKARSTATTHFNSTVKPGEAKMKISYMRAKKIMNY